MKFSRLSVLALFTMLYAGWLQADVVPVDPSHFQITLNEGGVFDPNGIGTWGAGTLFTGIPNAPAPEGGFPSGDLVCGDFDGFACFPPSSLLFEDPFGGTRIGGPSETITGEFTFNANANGGGTFDFHNGLTDEEGNPIAITSLELIATLPKSALPLTFSCSGGDAFDQCGFIITDPPDTITVQLFFSDGHIAPAPEPSTWMLFGTAALALVGRKALRRS